MHFNSYTFLLFFAVVCVLHYSPLSWKSKKLNLTLASYLFYTAWNPPFVLLLWISTVCDFQFGKLIHRTSSLVARRSYLALSLLINLGLLGYFKYSSFILENFSSILESVGIIYTAPNQNIILPVGISFYTFQTLSYTLDIYRRKLEPSKSFLDFALFVTFFPQLVAGPIVRAIDFLPQCIRQTRFNIKSFGHGLALMIFGVFQKSVMADALFSPSAEVVFNSENTPNFLSAWFGTFAFAGQILCDFSGYSITAIGVALCLGFSLPDNFRFPYAAIGFSDFWRRWHISLSSWLRDYLYISLGGNRKGLWHTRLNLLLTMLIGGLWHGASWNFVIWGGLHGIYLMLEHSLRHHKRVRIFKDWKFFNIVGALFTFLLVCVAWVFFRANSLDSALQIVAAMLGLTKGVPILSSLDLATVGVLTIALLSIQYQLRNCSLEAAATRLGTMPLSVTLAAMLFMITTLSGENRAFIYFQF